MTAQMRGVVPVKPSFSTPAEESEPFLQFWDGIAPVAELPAEN